jgi:hypothetical protein
MGTFDSSFAELEVYTKLGMPPFENSSCTRSLKRRIVAMLR